MSVRATFGSMMRQFVAALLLPFLMVRPAFAQPGQPFVTDIRFERSLGDLRVGRMLQAPDRSMLLCTERGIVTFDGALWELIATPSAPSTMTISNDGRVIVGMRTGAAELVLSDSGVFRFKNLLPGTYTDAIHQILVSDDRLFLINDARILIVDAATNALIDSLEFGDRVFSGAFLQFGVLHLFFYQEGLFSFQNGKLTPIGNYARLAEHQLLFDLSAPNGTYLCFDNGDLYLSDGIKMSRIDGELRDFLRANRVSDGILLNDSLMAFSTLAGGALVVERGSYAILHPLDYGTGLPDNEITALGRDDNGGLWMAYGAGLSRLDLLQPISRYHNYPGLKGVVATTAMHEGKLYVGTGSGVFVLTETRDRTELQRMVRERAEEASMPVPEPVRQRPEPIQQPVEPTPTEQDEQAELIARFEENPSEVKKELSRKELRELRKTIKQQKRNKASETVSETEDEQETQEKLPEAVPQEEKVTTQVARPAPAPATKSVARESMKQILGSRTGEQVSHVFRKVKGIDLKCRQLAVVGGKLLAATPNGVYEVKGESAVSVLSDVYVNHIGSGLDGNTALVATMSGPLTLSGKGGKWSHEWVDETFKVNVYNVVETEQGTLWAGAANMAIRYIRNSEGYVVKEFAIEGERLDRVLVVGLDGVAHLLLPDKVLKVEGDAVVQASIHGLDHSNERLEYLLGDRGEVWVHAGPVWHVLNAVGAERLLGFLPIFEDVRHLSLDDNGRLFVVDESFEVYSVHVPQGRTDGTPFSVFIRRATTDDSRPFGLGELVVRPGENSLTFHLSAPFYLKSMATEYQYMVEGLRDSWSRWHSSPTIEIPFLPPGNYVLQVRARNVLGEMSEVRSLQFTVLKPFWQRWYAILAYILALVGLVVAIIKARERSLRETQRELEEKVQERTMDLAKEKELTEKLLLNILPKETADELQKRGKATARHYNQVSVLFTDFKGFTRFAESTRPEDLVNELDRCFIAFDDIIGKYHLEKIKTIGDAYMCAGGVPIRNTNNAVAIVLAALEIRDFMKMLQAEKEANGERFWEIRIGIHTGPLTAGVVGKKKFAYDIWGDTVNTASRMESCSEPGKVNISTSTYELVKQFFDCTHRGKIDAKGKGLVEMYFVNGIKAEYSVGGDGVTPTPELLRSAD
jgi:class 3 adenylate cyclase